MPTSRSLSLTRPGLPEKEIVLLEQEVGFRFPPAYRAFLLICRGAIVVPWLIEPSTQELTEPLNGIEQHFYWSPDILYGTNVGTYFYMGRPHRIGNEGLPNGSFSVGRVKAGILYMYHETSNDPAVYLWTVAPPSRADEQAALDSQVMVTATFDELIAGIEI